MLTRLLAIIGETNGPVSLDDLSRRMGIQRTALTPMLDLLEQRGMLTEWHRDEIAVACGADGCGTSCQGVEGCPLVVSGMPRILELDRNV